MIARSVGFSALMILLCLAPAARARSVQLYFQDLGPTTYLPDQRVVLVVANPPASQAKIYAVPLEREITDFRNGWWNPKALDGLSQIASGRFRAQTDGHTQKLDLGPLPPGFYAASIGDGNNERRVTFSVSSFGLMRADAGGKIAVWAVDLRTFDGEQRSITMSAIAPESGRRRSLYVDPHGVAVDTPEGGDGVLVATAADGSLQVAGEGQNGSGDSGGAFVSTDRPIYRPGQSVNVRAILRDGSVGAYTVPHGTIQLKISYQNEDRVVATRTLPVSRFGTAAWTFRLPHDAQIGSYQISLGDRTGVGFFSVVAYRKPEFTLHLATGHLWTIAGDLTTVHVTAKYLFGRPAAGLHLSYAASVPGWYRDPRWMPLLFYRVFGDAQTSLPIDIVNSDALTDSQGRFDVTFRAPSVESEKLVAVEVRGSDASGRTVSTKLSLVDRPASFVVDARASRWFTQVGQTTSIEIQTHNNDGSLRPNQLLTVRIERAQWNQRQRHYDAVDLATQTAVTDAVGRATVSWTPVETGSYALVVQGRDERERTVSASSYVVAFSGGSAGNDTLPDRLIHVVPQKAILAPGERAHILVIAPVPDRDVLVTVCTDQLVRERVVHMTGTAVTLDEAPPPDAAKFSVGVTQADETGGSSDAALLTIDPPPHRLAVRIAPSRARYEPGETARLRIDVSDAYGRPVRAEVGLGVVDEAIYALQEDHHGAFDAFYGDASEAVGRGNWDLTAQPYRIGLRTIADVYALSAVPMPSARAAGDAYDVRVRQNFRDTAFWAPSVVTDARGRATVAFAWPDDLTTWRATGTAVTAATDIGTGTADTLVTKSFLVRVATPRFLRLGDESALTGIVQGTVAHPNVMLRMLAEALAPRAPAQHVTLDANATASALWFVRGVAIGTFPATLYGSDGVRADAMRTNLAVEGATPEEHVVASGVGNGVARMNVPPGYGAGSVTVTIAPSLLAQLIESLRLLQVYPYFCTEQTLSAALPALFVERALKRQNATAAFDLHTREIEAKALQRLRELEHDDGSYGWWERDAAHPFMTAYALYGLAELSKAGYPVSEAATVTSLIAQLQTSNDDTLRFWGGRQPNSQWNTRAFMLFALADAAPQRVPAAMLSEARAHVPTMNAYALAVLGLAEHAVGDDAAARAVLRALDARVVDDGTLAYWRGQTWDYAWEDDPIETTAYALRLQIALEPHDPLTARVVAFLRAQMRGGWAYTTKDTAATIYALSETLSPQGSELRPNETVRIALDGRSVQSLHVTSPVLDGAEAEVVIPAGDVRDGSIVSVTGSGSGTFYWSTDLTRYVPKTARAAIDKETPLLERLFPPRPDVTISRRYLPERPGPWRVGERVDVEITITSHRDLQYVAVDDPFPAGAEYPIEQGAAAADEWDRLDFLDDRASFFLDRLLAGDSFVLRYALDLTTAGRYTAPATTLTSMYGAPVRVLGQSETITIDPR